MKAQNPFIIVGEIPDEYFCDRIEETNTLCRLLAGGANVCLSAPRRLGKSKLIWHCFHQPQWQEYYTIYVDLYPTTDLNGFTKALGTAVFNQVQTWGEKVARAMAAALRTLRPSIKFDELTGNISWGIDWSTMNNIEPALDDIFAALQQADKPCIVAFDEFQQIAEYPEKNVEALLRGHIQNMANCHFIFSGSKHHLLSRIFTSSNRPFYQSTEPMPLHPIDLDKYEEFARKWMAHANKQVDEGVIAYIYQLAEGNTAFLQRTMHYAYDSLGEGECLTMDIARQAIQTMLEAADEFYKEQLSRLTSRQQDLLLAIAREGKAEKVMSGAFIKKYNLQSSSAVQAALKKLMDESWISENNGQYYIADTIFRSFLLR